MADCACSGIRSCLLCDKEKGGNQEGDETKIDKELIPFSFCIDCARVFAGNLCSHEKYATTGVDIPFILSGVTVIRDFVSEEEELYIMTEIEKFPWKASQSGRTKQDFGPKANFRKKKVKLGQFSGLPNFSKFIVERIHQNVSILSDFVPVELCNLDYCPERGSSIDPHFDDFWLWGEHLVTLNLLSDTILTLTDEKYEVRVPIPRFSLLVLGGVARYKWMHCIKRSDIKARRIAVTLRELSSEFLSGAGYDEVGRAVLELAASFNGLPTTS